MCRYRTNDPIINRESAREYTSTPRCPDSRCKLMNSATKKKTKPQKLAKTRRTIIKITHGPLQSLTVVSRADGDKQHENRSLETRSIVHEPQQHTVHYRGATIPFPAPVSSTVWEIFVDRLQKEIIRPCQETARSRFVDTKGNHITWKELRKRRFLVGTNSCTQMLESSPSKVLLVVLSVDSITVAAHIPLLLKYQQQQSGDNDSTPVKLCCFPSEAILQLVKLFGGLRRLACFGIVSAPSISSSEDAGDRAVDSFASFIVSLL